MLRKGSSLRYLHHLYLLRCCRFLEHWKYYWFNKILLDLIDASSHPLANPTSLRNYVRYLVTTRLFWKLSAGILKTYQKLFYVELKRVLLLNIFGTILHLQQCMGACFSSLRGWKGLACYQGQVWPEPSTGLPCPRFQALGLTMVSFLWRNMLVL